MRLLSSSSSCWVTIHVEEEEGCDRDTSDNDDEYVCPGMRNAPDPAELLPLYESKIGSPLCNLRSPAAAAVTAVSRMFGDNKPEVSIPSAGMTGAPEATVGHPESGCKKREL